MKNKGIRFIVYTAVFIALLVVFQSLSAKLGQLVTGSLVNFVLIAACVLGGWKSGLVVALVSPVFARFFGIGPLWELIPFVALGNASLVGVYALVLKIKLPLYVRWVIAVIAAAGIKFAVLFASIVKVMIPYLKLPAKKAAMMSAMFGTPQLITALIGGAIALVVIPLVKRGLDKSK